MRWSKAFKLGGVVGSTIILANCICQYSDERCRAGEYFLPELVEAIGEFDDCRTNARGVVECPTYDKVNDINRDLGALPSGGREGCSAVDSEDLAGPVDCAPGDQYVVEGG